MFKKTLVAVAAFAAVAGSAFAADVQLYGRVDTGVRYTSSNTDVKGADDVTKFEMASGNYTGSRFGVKGEEDLGNGLKVAFVLENGFSSDSGSLGTEDTLFDRQASLHVKGEFGELAFGRMGILNSTAGTFGIANFSSMETGWGNVGDQNMIWGAGFASRYDNMITYASPEFAGAKFFAQYSNGANSRVDDDDKVLGTEGKSSVDRYAGLGMTYNAGALALRAVVDTINKNSWNNVAGTVDDAAVAAGSKDVDDAVRVTVGGSYDFGMVKPFLTAAYFKDASVSKLGGIHSVGGVYDGYGLMVGAKAPLVGGTLSVTAGYMDAEKQGADVASDKKDVTRFILGAGYEYKLSKRTLVYVDAGYGQDDNEVTGLKPEYYQAAAGLAHYF